MSVKKIYICGIKQESNSFNTTVSSLKDFSIQERESLKLSNNERVKGIVKALAEEKMEAVWGPCFWASPNGPLSDEVVDLLLQKIGKDLKNIGKIDGIAIIFHGATVSETSEDVCGDVSEFIREIVGNYPTDGKIKVFVKCDMKEKFSIQFRKPSW